MTIQRLVNAFLLSVIVLNTTASENDANYCRKLKDGLKGGALLSGSIGAGSALASFFFPPLSPAIAVGIAGAKKGFNLSKEALLGKRFYQGANAHFLGDGKHADYFIRIARDWHKNPAELAEYLYFTDVITSVRDVSLCTLDGIQESLESIANT